MYSVHYRCTVYTTGVQCTLQVSVVQVSSHIHYLPRNTSSSAVNTPEYRHTQVYSVHYRCTAYTTCQWHIIISWWEGNLPVHSHTHYVEFHLSAHNNQNYTNNSNNNANKVQIIITFYAPTYVNLQSTGVLMKTESITISLKQVFSTMFFDGGWWGFRTTWEYEGANLPNRYSALCWRPVMHAQTWARYSALYRFGRLCYERLELGLG